MSAKFNYQQGYEEAKSDYDKYIQATIWSQTLIEGQTLKYNSVLKYFNPLQSLRTPLNQIFTKSEKVSAYTINLLNCLKSDWDLISSWLNDDQMTIIVDCSNLILLNWKAAQCEQITPGLRKHPVKIGGSTYLPDPLITVVHYENMISNINQIEDQLNAILTQFAHLCKQQLFNDGNKRSALLLANYQLIKSRIVKQMFVPADRITEFKKHLIDYYEDEQKLQQLIKFLKQHCLKFTNAYLQYCKLQKSKSLKG